jgi:hypothetical protein
MAFQIYFALSFVGRPDTRSSRWQFPPFDPSLPGGMLLVVLPHEGIMRDRCLVAKRGDRSAGKFGREVDGGLHHSTEGRARDSHWLVPVAPVWGGEGSDYERGSFVLFVGQLLLMHAYPRIDLWR